MDVEIQKLIDANNDMERKLKEFHQELEQNKQKTGYTEADKNVDRMEKVENMGDELWNQYEQEWYSL